MDERRLAEHFCREIDARRVLPDDRVFRRLLDARAAGRIAAQIDRAGQRPVILPGRRAAIENRAVAHRQTGALVSERGGGMVEKHFPDLGADQPQRDSAELDRLAAGRIALVRGQRGVAGLQYDARRIDAEFLGRDLPHRGQNPLPDLDPPGRYPHFSRLGKPDPLVEPGVLLQQRRQRAWSIAHRPPSPRICAAARSTARRIRAWLPQRQILSSSARAISSRLGAGFASSNAFAVTMIPGRQ